MTPAAMIEDALSLALLLALGLSALTFGPALLGVIVEISR